MSCHPIPQATRSNSSPRFALRPAAVAVHLLLAGVAVGGWVGAAQAQTATAASTRSYSIPAGPLNVVMTRFLGESGVLLSGSTELAQGKRSPGVRGKMTPDAALATLLAGTGLQAVADAQGRYVLKAVPVVSPDSDVQLAPVTVNASADASAGGLVKPYAGGQIARGGRVGILGNRDIMETPFNTTAYTTELIQDQQAKSVGDVLLNDPAVRVARGFGNFQESYFIRGFLLNSDHVAYNGLYSLLPRQYISAELFERVEVLRGASAFLIGATPGGDGIGGSINLLPKRAPNESLTRFTMGAMTGEQGFASVDFARRFGPDKSSGVRVVAAKRDGGTSIENEKVKLDVALIGVDWRGDKARMSADIGYQDHKLDETRTNVRFGAITSLPKAPKSDSNWAQPWSFSNERDTFGTLRGEYDFSDSVTGWLAAGARRTKEHNSLANIIVSNGTTGAATTSRFDNTREDSVNTGEVGLRGKLKTGSVGHDWVVSGSYFEIESKSAFDFAGSLATNLYDPVSRPRPNLTGTLPQNNLASPPLSFRTRLASLALGDTLSLLDDTLLMTLGVRHQMLYSATYNRNTGAKTTEYEEKRISPALGVIFKLRPDLSVYGNYIESLAQGEAAPNTAANSGEILSPYVSKQKEVGVKYDGGEFGGVLALFATRKPRGFVNASNVFEAAGEDSHRGLEFTAYGTPMRGLKVLGGVTFLDAQQADTGNVATEGKRVIGVPNRQANLGVEWSVPGVVGLLIDARLIATGAVYADATNTLRVPGWSRLDMGARYMTEVAGRLVTLRARVDNATDRDYWASSGGFPNNGYLVLGTPRTLSFSASLDF